MDISPQAAFDWIKGKLDDFYQKGNTLYAQEDALNQLMALYTAQNIDSSEVANTFNEVNNELLSWQSISK